MLQNSDKAAEQVPLNSISVKKHTDAYRPDNDHIVRDSFDQFARVLGESRDEPLPGETLRTVFGVQVKNFPRYAALHTHYRNDFQLYVNKDGVKVRWSVRDKQLLAWVVLQYLRHFRVPVHEDAFDDLDYQHWKELQHVLGIKALCLKRTWIGLLRKGETAKAWTPEEDDIIMREMQNGKDLYAKWKVISEEILRSSSTHHFRSSRQIRARWFNYLKPEIRKTKWTPIEDKMLLNEVLRIGKKWSLIAQNIPSRNFNQVKNRYWSLIRPYLNKDEDRMRNEEHFGEVNSTEREQGIVRNLLVRIADNIDYNEDVQIDKKSAKKGRDDASFKKRQRDAENPTLEYLTSRSNVTKSLQDLQLAQDSQTTGAYQNANQTGKACDKVIQYQCTSVISVQGSNKSADARANLATKKDVRMVRIVCAVLQPHCIGDIGTSNQMAKAAPVRSKSGSMSWEMSD